MDVPSRVFVTRNFEDYVSNIFYVCLSIKIALSFLLALVPVLHGCHPHIYLSCGRMILCKLACHREILILFMANANANLCTNFLSFSFIHHFFSYFYTKVSTCIFMSGSSVKIMFTSCICLFSYFGNCQP